MKLKKLFLISLLTVVGMILSDHAHAMHLVRATKISRPLRRSKVHQVQRTYARNHPLPTYDTQLTTDVKNVLDAHCEELARAMDCVLVKHFAYGTIAEPIRNVASFDWLPRYLVKQDPYSRMKGAKILRDVIEENNLDLITLPKMWQYEVPMQKIRPALLKALVLCPRSLCIAECLEGDVEKPITLEQAKQLCLLFAKSKYSDGKGINLLRCPDGTIGMIDTEIRSFNECGNGNLEYFLNTCALEPDAREYIESVIVEQKRTSKL